MTNYVPIEKSIEIKEGFVSVIKFSPRGDRMLCCTTMGYAILYSFPELVELKKREVNNKGINNVSFAPDGSFFVTAGDDFSANLVETETLNVIRRFRGPNGHEAPVLCCAVSNDGTRIITGSEDVSFKIWDPRKYKPVNEVGGHTEPLSSVSYNYDDTLILSGGYDGIVRVWDSTSYICLRTYVDNGNPISKCLFTPNSCFVVMFSLGGSVKLVELKSGEEYRRFEGLVNEKFLIEAKFIRPESNQGGELIATSEDNSIIGWDVATSKLLWKVPIDEFTNVCDALDDGSVIAYAPSDQQIVKFLERKEN